MRARKGRGGRATVADGLAQFSFVAALLLLATILVVRETGDSPLVEPLELFLVLAVGLPAVASKLLSLRDKWTR